MMSAVRLACAKLLRAPTNSPMDQRQVAQAVLNGARTVIGRGWLQGGWYVVEAPDGRRRLITASSMTPRSFGEVRQACLVGAVVEAATWHGPPREVAGPVLDILWCALQEQRGVRVDRRHWSTAPAARSARVRELARWNDEPTRSRDEVEQLLDLARSGQLPDVPADPALGAPLPVT